MDADYPKDMADGFSGVPENVDTAMVWSGNGKIYFFKGFFQKSFSIVLGKNNLTLFSAFRTKILAVRSDIAPAGQVYLSERRVQLGRTSQRPGRRISVHQRLQLLFQKRTVLALQRQILQGGRRLAVVSKAGGQVVVWLRRPSQLQVRLQPRRLAGHQLRPAACRRQGRRPPRCR